MINKKNLTVFLLLIAISILFVFSKLDASVQPNDLENMTASISDRLEDILKEFDNVLTSSVDYDYANNQVNIVLELAGTDLLKPQQKENMESITKAIFSAIDDVSVSIDVQK